MKKSPTIGALAAALARAQSQYTVARCDERNPQFRDHWFASMKSLKESTVGPLTKNGISVTQWSAPTGKEDLLLIQTLVAHGPSGEWAMSELPMPVLPMPGKKEITAHAVATALSYGDRYSYKRAVGAVTEPNRGEDDDGNLASGYVNTTLARDAAPNMTRDRLPDYPFPARSGADGAGAKGQARPSGPEPAGGAPRTAQQVADAFDERNPPPPM